MTQAFVSAGLWALAWRRLRADRFAMAALAVLGGFALLVALAAAGLAGADWDEEVAPSYAPPAWSPAVAAPAAVAARARAAHNPHDPLDATLQSLQHARAGQALAAPNAYRTVPAGADRWGRDVLKKVIKGAQTSITVGVAAALLAVAIGTLFGALAGYCGGWVDDVFNWCYSVFTSVPAILLILAVAAVLQQRGMATIILILGLTGWTGPFRLMRAEYLKHRGRDYVRAADAIGASHWRRMVRHIFPNVSHVALVQLSVLVVSFIKSEVILSFLGFGVPVGVVSWGSMLSEAQNELILGHWWQLACTSAAMALMVTAFALLTDAMRDALDPTLK